MSKVQLLDSVRYRLLNLTERIYIVGDYIIEAMISEDEDSYHKCSIGSKSCSYNNIFGGKRMILCMAVAEEIGEYVNPYSSIHKTKR